MDDQKIKQAVLDVIARSVDPRALAAALEPELTGGPRPGRDAPAREPGTRRLLVRVVLGDILDDAILSARPQDRTFPLRLLFSELGRLLATDAEEGPEAQAAEQAFTLASGLNFFFRASMDDEARLRLGIEVSRQLYALADAAKLDAELVAKAAPLVAALMTSQLERVKLESVDHMKVFDSQLHDRTASSDPTGARILRPASFLCRVASNGAIKAKAQVVT